METLEGFYDRHCERYRRAAEDVETKLRRAVADIGKRGRLRAPSVSSRCKRRERFLQKARRKGATATTVTSLVRDFAGVRVVCRNRQDVDEVVALIKQHPELTFVGVDDHTDHPTEAGYRGVHVIVETTVTEGTTAAAVKCEVQVMTLLQSAWAEFGHEDLYEREDAPARRVRSARRVAELLSVVDDIPQDIREELESEAPMPQAPLEEGGAGLSDHEIAVFFEDMAGRPLTVAELPEAAEALNSSPLDLPGGLDRDVWEKASQGTQSLYTGTLQLAGAPDDFDTLVYGVPLAWGADPIEIAFRAAEDYGLTVCPRCGRRTWESDMVVDKHGHRGAACRDCGHVSRPPDDAAK